jgi:hypothetical protein
MPPGKVEALYQPDQRGRSEVAARRTSFAGWGFVQVDARKGLDWGDTWRGRGRCAPSPDYASEVEPGWTNTVEMILWTTLALVAMLGLARGR